MNTRYVVVGMMLTATTVTGAKQPVSIRVSPEIAFAPANVVIRTSVEPATENRSIEVIAESGEFYRSSTIQLEGDRAPKTTMLEFRALPPGNYDVSASVIGSGGQRRAVAHMQVKVLGSEGIPE
jgi:predicted phage tail protein